MGTRFFPILLALALTGCVASDGIWEDIEGQNLAQALQAGMPSVGTERELRGLLGEPFRVTVQGDSRSLLYRNVRRRVSTEAVLGIEIARHETCFVSFSLWQVVSERVVSHATWGQDGKCSEFDARHA